MLAGTLASPLAFAQATPSAKAHAQTKATSAPKAKTVANRTQVSGQASKAKQSRKKAGAKKISTPIVSGPAYAEREDAMLLAEDIARRRGLDLQWTKSVVANARLVPAIVRASTPPAVGVAKNWALYRSRFIDPVRTQAGVQYWRTHADLLRRAEQEYGVPAEIIVGIIGVETIYGQQTGNYRVMDALCTLSFDFPKEHPRAGARAAFFRTELEEFLVLTARTKTDPLALRGSYAGAMGLPQFMPSSWSRYAVDFDADGRVDLFHSHADVIGSVAHYFKMFRWQSGMPTHYPVSFDNARLDKAALLAPDILPTFNVPAFQALGAVLQGPALLHAGPLALVELQNGDAAPQYVAGTENFYAITRYNWSSYYAMAVIELGQAVRQALGADTGNAVPNAVSSAIPNAAPPADGMPK